MPTYSPKRRYEIACGRIGRAKAETLAAYRARDIAVADLYEKRGLSYRLLGEEIGMTGSRIQQIVEQRKAGTL